MEDDDQYEQSRYIPLKQRKAAEARRIANLRFKGMESENNVLPNDNQGTEESNDRRPIPEDEDETGISTVQRSKQILLKQAREIRQKQEKEGKTEEEKQAEEERKILEAHAARRKLASDMELAKGISYTEPIKTSWRAPHFIRKRTEEESVALREKYHILADGKDVPPLIENFRDMKIPPCIIEYLLSKGIKTPTQIQMQGLPTAFSGSRYDWNRIHGKWKNAGFQSSDLNTYENLQTMAEVLSHDGYPKVGVLLCIGGISMAEQYHTLSKGFHIVVATPGRLQDMLDKKKFTLDCCKYLCLDEADRMIDMGFEDDVRTIMGFFKQQRQTLLYSATMPQKIRTFAEESLIAPIVVNVGRAGAANLSIIQSVEYVKQEAKLMYLLEVLQKTAPPVIVFSDNKNEVDDIQEFLLRKGVEADVMVANSVASKGLDFPDIQHVINFSMPKDIEEYVHQIGRTGRGGKTGLATTFVNSSAEEASLLDLKYLLIEAKQHVPPFLLAIQDTQGGGSGCQFCGGLGHSIANCPKLDRQQTRQRAGFSGGDGGGGGGY
ncbi:hypothetical protein L7F22_019791 [Adiantum nelumboides]|nr:hypothetical protein [Adiantum nelumboides]